MSRHVLGADACRRALSLRDLTDPALGPHAMQLLLDAIVGSLQRAFGCEVIVHRASPIVSIEDNYDRLHYPPDGAARDARYTRYVSETEVLRTQTSAMVPPLLQRLAAAPSDDVLLVCPGLVYRRDTIDRLHTGEPHQVDLWRIRRGPALAPRDLRGMVESVVAAALRGRPLRCTEAVHPYTTDGLQIDVGEGDGWVEVGECGLALGALLEEAGLPTRSFSGLAMGLGLDRILMLRKGIDDIRLLRATDARIARQMLDLAPYRPVSSQPPVRRDLSIATRLDTTAEELGDLVRAALGDRAPSVELVQVVSETPHEALPPAAVQRLGSAPGQKNVLLRVVIRDVERTLTHEEANALRDAIFAALHEGRVHHWASVRPPSGRGA
ncbi:PheS-related mystery ligase SrmL [Sorangium sp. So ce1078]|uniref:PheS-related mystery ligase SrmL n=1 Tax=Sorangium sp. So ce1078 TaxID=3133329 RepID=UPI003F5E48F9